MKPLTTRSAAVCAAARALGVSFERSYSSVLKDGTIVVKLFRVSGKVADFFHACGPVSERVAFSRSSNDHPVSLRVYISPKRFHGKGHFNTIYQTIVLSSLTARKMSQKEPKLRELVAAVSRNPQLSQFSQTDLMVELYSLYARAS